MSNGVVHVGSAAPGFTLGSTSGPISLAQYRDRQNVVLYFMRAFT